MKITADNLLKAIKDGYTIVIANYMHAWEINAKVVARWEKAGRPILKQAGENILMGSGKNYVDIRGCSVKAYK